MKYQRESVYRPQRYADLHGRGITGTRLSGGTISGYESNPSLTDPAAWAQICIDMMRTDPIIRRSWSILKQTLLSASYRWESADPDSELANELARYANEAWGLDGYSGHMSVPWETQLQYLFEFIPVGYRYAECIYKIERGERGVQVWLDRFADREPTSHYKWLTEDQQNLLGVIQNTVSGVSPEPIPSDKMLLLTLGFTGSNWAGNGGYLRPCHYYYRAKQRSMNLLMMGVERWASPTPVVKVDMEQAERMGLTEAELSAAVDEAEQQAAAYVAHETSYLVTSPAIEFEAYGGANSGMSSAMALDVIRECDSQITNAFLANMMQLGSVGTDTGSRAVGQVHESFFRRSALNLVQLVCEAVGGIDRAGGGIIHRLIKFNYGEVNHAYLPRLVHSGLDVDALSENLQQLSTLVSSGILTPDAQLETMVRDRIGAPDLAESDERTTIDRLTPAGGGSLFSELNRIKKRRGQNG